MESGERLQKVLARAGVASRRAAEKLIEERRVRVNGMVVQKQGTRVDPWHDAIEVDGRPIARIEKRVVIALHKPRGVVSTVHDPQGRPTVVDLVKTEYRLYPVGRLDFASEGLLLLTNDGHLTHTLTHPRHEVEKEYEVWVTGQMSPETCQRLAFGVDLEDGRTAPAKVRLLKTERHRSHISIVLREGRNRQVRRMCAVVGHPVLRLIRVRIGPLYLGSLPPGAYRTLNADEIRNLLKAACLDHSSLHRM